MTRFWAGVVTELGDVPRHTVTTHQPPPAELPAAYTAAGWSLHNDFDVWFYASHPEHGKTDTVNLMGNRPDLSMRRLIKGIDFLCPLSNLTTTAVSQRLNAVNEAIAVMERQMSQLNERTQQLAGRRCNGRVRYRTAKSHTVFVYTDHTAGIPCPYCGEHPDGKRLRRYHGEEETGPANDAMRAIADEQEYQEKRAELDALNGAVQKVDRLVWQLELATGIQSW